MTRRFLASLAATILLLGGCRGAVTARGMKALGPWSDREIVVAPAQPSEPETIAWSRVGAIEGLGAAGLTFEKGSRPGALEVRVREVKPDEGRETLLSSPSTFAATAATQVVGGAARVAAQEGNGLVGSAGKVAGTAIAVAGGVAAVRESTRVRMAVELFAPNRTSPVGGVVWEGYRNLDRNGAAETAGREAGEVLGHEIASQRDRWIDRRPASERLFLTPTPLLLQEGEAVVSLDQGLLLHAGYGARSWLQLDVLTGGWLVPTASGPVHSHRDGLAVLGALGFGAKVRLADEGPLWPGLSASYDRLWLWSGSIGTGRIVLLDHVVDASSEDASSGVGLNVFTLAVSKHPLEWLQVGGGALVVDNHPLFGSGTPMVEPDGSHPSERLPTQLLPYLNVEARAGEHFRFVSEYLYSSGGVALSLGVRTLLFGSRKFGELRTAGYRVRLDTAAIIAGRETESGSTLAVLPWIGVAFYPR